MAATAYADPYEAKLAALRAEKEKHVSAAPKGACTPQLWATPHELL